MAKKTAVYKDDATNAKITLIQNDDNSIDFEVNNALGVMRLISKAIGFEYDPEWNTQTLGRKLIDVLNNANHDTKEIKMEKADTIDKFYHWYELVQKGELTQEEVDIARQSGEFYEALSEDEYDKKSDELAEKLGIDWGDLEDYVGGMSDEAWNWWVNLSDSMKLILLHYMSGFSDFEDDFGEMPYLSDEYLYVDDSCEEETDYTIAENTKSPLWYYFGDFILENDLELNITEVEESGCCDGSLQYDFEQLAYLPNLKSMSFYRDEALCFFPPSLSKLAALTKLDIGRTEAGSEEEDMDNLFAFAKAHPNMEYLGLSGSILGNELDDNREKLAELQALMPNCNIEL